MKLVTKKVRKTTNSVLIAFVLLALTVTTVLAAPPLDVHIEVEEEANTSGETFFASGAAVDDGIVCSTGTVDDLVVDVAGPPGGTFAILNVLKRFGCADSSGTFDVKLVVRLDLTTNETTARWNVVGGTGDYLSLHGNGSLVGTPIVQGESILDVYDGRMH
jgi:hypothetical protein